MEVLNIVACYTKVCLQNFLENFLSVLLSYRVVVAAVLSLCFHVRSQRLSLDYRVALPTNNEYILKRFSNSCQKSTVRKRISEATFVEPWQELRLQWEFQIGSAMRIYVKSGILTDETRCLHCETMTATYDTFFELFEKLQLNLDIKCREHIFPSQVLQGQLKHGKYIAIKVISAQSRLGVGEFLTEINVICQIEHANLRSSIVVAVEKILEFWSTNTWRITA
ncbi:hypothetical protein ACFE04_027400 [Oxalis oulophora]